MISKTINNNQFKEAIKTSFINDEYIFHAYNPTVKVETIGDIIKDISTRINEDVSNAEIKGVYDKNILVGYYVFDLPHKTLVSFGLNVGYRKRKYLKELWSLIRADLKGKFQAFLWSRNLRACKWLQKNGMKIVAADNLLTHLIY
jgi:hypothetical protein